jgi:predicted  nucleic acid-binding Zn-ribbon protein
MLEEADMEIEAKNNEIMLNEKWSKGKALILISLEFLKDANNYALKILEVLKEQNRLEYKKYEKMKEIYNTQIIGLNEKIKEFKENEFRKQLDEHNIQQQKILLSYEQEIDKLNNDISKIELKHFEYEEVGLGLPIDNK